MTPYGYNNKQNIMFKRINVKGLRKHFTRFLQPLHEPIFFFFSFDVPIIFYVFFTFPRLFVIGNNNEFYKKTNNNEKFDMID